MTRKAWVMLAVLAVSVGLLATSFFVSWNYGGRLLVALGVLLAQVVVAINVLWEGLRRRGPRVTDWSRRADWSDEGTLRYWLAPHTSSVTGFSVLNCAMQTAVQELEEHLRDLQARGADIGAMTKRFGLTHRVEQQGSKVILVAEFHPLGAE